MKRGILSFIIYTILFGIVGFLTLQLKLEIDANQGNYEGFEGLGAGLGLAIFLIFTIILAIPFVLKLIHVISGWGFFGFLCVLVDIAFIGLLVYSVITSIPSGASFDFVGNLPILAGISAIAVALASDVMSLKR